MAQTVIKSRTLTGLWLIKGDEELPPHYMSRTAAPGWGWEIKQAPSVMRYSPHPEPEPSEYTVNITALDPDIRRLNRDIDKKINFLYAGASALFNTREPDANGWGYPTQQCLVMQGNLLEGVREGEYLKFKTLTPASYARHLTRAEHPQFVHRFDIVTYRMMGDRVETFHKATEQGEIYYLLVSRSGVGYVPLEWVRQL